MYLIGTLPNPDKNSFESIHVIFSYGARMTEKRRSKINEELLSFVSERYDIPNEHKTIKRTEETIKTRFDKHSTYKRNEHGFKADNWGVNSTNIHFIDCEV